VIGTYRSSRCQIALTHYKACDQKRIVVMLLVSGKYQVIQHLTARNGGIVAHKGMEQACPILQIRIISHNESNCFAPVENMASETNDAIDHLDAFSYLRRFRLGGINSQIFKFVGAFDVAVGANFYIFYRTRVLDHTLIANRSVKTTPLVKTVLRYLFQLLLQKRIIPVLCPDIGICSYHTIERHHTSAAGLIHQVQPDTYVFVLSVFDDSIAEFCMVGRVHFIYINQNAALADYIVSQVSNIMNRNIIADIACDYPAVGNARRHLEIMVFQNNITHTSNADQPEKL
jgi:hypothetical protein